MRRLTPKTREELNPEQQQQFDRISRMRPARADGQFGGPFDPWIRSPELAQRAVSFGNFLWERTTLDRKIVELAISVTARFWESNVEWTAHAPRAVQHGVSQAVIDSVMRLEAPAGGPEDEAVTIEVCRAMHERHALTDELYQRAVAVFGEQGLVEIIATIGYYTLVAMTLAGFAVEPAPGVERPFEK